MDGQQQRSSTVLDFDEGRVAQCAVAITATTMLV
jgi:hypothetical protein